MSREIEAEAVGPGALLSVGDELKAGGHIQGAPLDVGDPAAVQVGDLLLGEGLVVTDILQIYLDDLEGFGGIPVHKRTGGARTAMTEGGHRPGGGYAARCAGWCPPGDF